MSKGLVSVQFVRISFCFLSFLFFSFLVFFSAAARVAFLDCAVESEVVDSSLSEFIRILVCLGCYGFL